MSELLDSILNQIRACEANPGSLLPATSGNIGAYVTCDGEWDIFLFANPGAQTSAPQEIVNGLWKFSNEISIEGEQNQFTALRTTRQNRLHFSGFIADLIEKLDTMDFAEALNLTLAEWRSRWRMRATDLSFIQRVGLFGELVALRDFLGSNNVNDTEPWVARDSGKGLHDFDFGLQIFEVKSTTQGVAEIHIFDEAQLHHREGLSLLLVKLEMSEDGNSIDDLTNEILSLIDSALSREIFLSKLDRTGFSFGKFEEDRFIVRSKRYWESSPDSPFIQAEDIDREIRFPMNISYNVLEENVPFREIADFLSLLNIPD
jgi:hypothetical protein